MDYNFPLTETINGKRHLSIVMDHLTKWCVVFPIKNYKAKTVADILVSHVFSRMGHDICQLIGTRKSRTTYYHPQCDSLVEGQIRTFTRTFISLYYRLST